MDDFELNLAVEDKFVLFGLNKPNGLLPDGYRLSALVDSLGLIKQQYKILLDISGMDTVTEDVIEFCTEMKIGDIIVNSQDQDLLDDWPKKLKKPLLIDRPSWQYQSISCAHLLNRDERRSYALHDTFNDILKQIDRSLPTELEWKALVDFDEVFNSFNEYTEYLQHMREDSRYEDDTHPDRVILGSRYLQAQIEQIGRRSLMTQIAITARNGVLHAAPYHSHAAFSSAEIIGAPPLLCRPGIIAHKTQLLFKDALDEFNYLIKDPDCSEPQLQAFFERNPAFLKMLGYKSIRPQVILVRDDGSELKPDFMLEPMDGELWDILDIKKANVPFIVGPKDRKAASHHVYQLIAQLREYGAYFEEERHRKYAKDKYGIQAYKPILTGIIGYDYGTIDPLARQRVLTQLQPDRIYTYKQIYERALNLPLF